MERSERFTDVSTMNGVIIKPLKRFEDGRGWLTEFFRSDEIENVLIPAMGYASFTKPGLSRGPHEHLIQTDMFFFPGVGSFLIAVWDNRIESPTYLKRMTVTTAENSPVVALISPNIVHGYHCISKSAGLVINVPNKLYRGHGKKDPVDEVRHEDDPSSPFTLDFLRLTREGTR